MRTSLTTVLTLGVLTVLPTCRTTAPADPAPTDGPLASEPASSTAPTPLEFSRLSAGRDHSARLHTDGGAEIWGAKVCGNGHSLTRCWMTPDGNSRRLPPDAYLKLSSADGQICGLRTDRSFVCGGMLPMGAPSKLPGPFKDVSLGPFHLCAVRTDGRALCWGDLGDHDFGQTRPPEARFTRIAAGGRHTCGLTETGRIRCWGVGSKPDKKEYLHDHNQSIPPEGRFEQISAGNRHTCALRRTGRLVCWGADVHDVPDKPAFDAPFVRVSAGAWHTCAIRFDNTLHCWGGPGDGRADPPEGKFVDVAAGDQHTCALRMDDSVECWGSDAGDPYGATSPP